MRTPADAGQPGSTDRAADFVKPTINEQAVEPWKQQHVHTRESSAPFFSRGRATSTERCASNLPPCGSDRIPTHFQLSPTTHALPPGRYTLTGLWLPPPTGRDALLLAKGCAANRAQRPALGRQNQHGIELPGQTLPSPIGTVLQPIQRHTPDRAVAPDRTQHPASGGATQPLPPQPSAPQPIRRWSGVTAG